VHPLTQSGHTPSSASSSSSSKTSSSSSKAVGVGEKAALLLGQFALSKDTRCCGGLITCIRRAGWFDQQNVDLPACHGPMLNPLWHDKHLAGAEGNRAIPQLDVERSFEDKKKSSVSSCLCQWNGPSSLATMMSLSL
jgi:hypothetical protein